MPSACGDLLECLAPRAEVAGPLQLVLRERLLGVAGDGLLRSSCRRAAAPGSSPGHRAQPVSQSANAATSAGNSGTRSSEATRLAGLAAVDLQQKRGPGRRAGSSVFSATQPR